MACRSRSRSPSRGLEEAVQRLKQSFYSQQVTLQDNYCKKYIVVCCVNYSLDLPKDLELFLRNYHKGKIETILSHKEPIELHNLFLPPPLVVLPPPPPPGRVYLIEGAPGGGKSTLALHICHQWAQGASWLAEFNVVVLAYLRDEAVQNANTLAEILPARTLEISQSIATQLQDTDGKNVLFILDGWDEFPQHLMNNSLVSTLIHQPHKLSLHRSTVLITSRPVSSGNLLQFSYRRIEILGFTQHQIREYICKALDGNSNLVQKLVQHLEDHPVIEGYCYIPLHSAILVHIFLTLKGTLPTTHHEIFCSLVLCCIIREQATHEPDNKLPEISSLDDLPDYLKTKLSELCVLAYNGVMQNKIVFYSKDLQSFHVPTTLSSLGLLQAVEGLTLTSKSLSYNFLHLSIQELLAAYNISLMDPSEQVKVFKQLFDSSRLEAVLQYYSGFTKLDNPDIQECISSYQHGKSHLKDLLPLLHCFYEAQQSSLCQLIDPRFDPGELDCSFRTPVDHLVIGYFITSILTATSRMSCVSLSYQSTKDQHGLKLLLSELSKYRVGAGSKKVNLNLSGISEQEAKYVKQSLTIISNLRMTDCDGECVLHIIEALQTNTSLTELHLINSSPPKTSSALIKMLQINTSLKYLEVSGKELDQLFVTFDDPQTHPRLDRSLSDSGARCIFEGLQHNTTLVNLSLCKNGITATNPDTARSLTKMLQVNKSLTHLDLSQNRLCDSVLHYIFEGVHHNTSLVNLSLRKNCITATDLDTARSLTKMLQVNKSLTHLDLLQNDLSDSGACCIFEGLQRCSELLSRRVNDQVLDVSEDHQM